MHTNKVPFLQNSRFAIKQPFSVFTSQRSVEYIARGVDTNSELNVFDNYNDFTVQPNFFIIIYV